MGYKEEFKHNELKHELAAEEEDMLRSMTPEERRKYLREEAEMLARIKNK